MDFVKLYEELRDLEESDYKRIGLRGNPAYSDLRCGYEPKINISRKNLEDELINAIEMFISGDKIKHIYLFSRESGAGKTHTQNILREYCRKKGILFADASSYDTEINLQEIIPYILELMKSEKIVIFVECDMPSELYTKLANIPQCFIIGSGHNPYEELDKVKNLFRILDIEQDYPLTDDQIYKLLKVTMDELKVDDTVNIDDEFLKTIARNISIPGNALNVLGILLAIIAYKAKKGEAYKITDRDINIWINENMFGCFS